MRIPEVVYLEKYIIMAHTARTSRTSDLKTVFYVTGKTFSDFFFCILRIVGDANMFLLSFEIFEET